MTKIDELLTRHPIITEQITATELRVLLLELERALVQKVTGDVVELGCYEGTSALFIQRLLQAYDSDKKLFLYDSFEGLPSKTPEDASPIGEQFKAGELHASRKQLIKNFQQAGLPLPIVKKAWFKELTPIDLPPKIAFAFLDGDFYTSILESLKLIWPHLSHGSTIIIDDYLMEALPGVRKAVEAWGKSHHFSLLTQASLAIIRPTL